MLTKEHRQFALTKEERLFFWGDEAVAGKAALVTGGSSGIGLGIVRMLAEEQYDIVLAHYNDEAQANVVQQEVQSQFGQACHVFSGNLAHTEVVLDLASFAIAKLGEISVLVNNAGVTKYTETRELDVDTVDHLYGLNFRAPILLAREIGQHMVAQHISGTMINIASTRAFRAYPMDSVYGGLKAALVRATESMALDLAPYHIRVNAVAPGAIRVRLGPAGESFYAELGARIPAGRMGRPEDVAEVVRWLISKQAEYVTGAAIRVDGGLILPGMPERPGNQGWGRS